MNLLELAKVVGNHMETVMLTLIVLAITISIFSRSKLKVPGGKGFKNIKLPPLKPRMSKNALAFRNLVKGTLIIGGAGSGKTKSLIEPLISQVVKEQYSGIIYDFKFPVIASFAYKEAQHSRSTKIKYFYVNFDDLPRSHRFNVFASVGNSSYAQEYASSFMMNLLPESIKSPDFFLRTATALLSASILYFSKREKQICTLPHIISFLLNSDIPKIIEIISRDPEAADIVSSVRSGLASERQTAGVVATLQNSLSTCANPKIFWVLSGNSFDLNLNSPADPKLLVIGNKAALINSVSPIISLIITVASKQMNEAGKERSIILLDEGPTLFIPNFDTIPSTGRENKIATVFCGQDIAQMEERYGEKKAEVLISNMANQFYGKISNPKTAEKVVKIFDKEEVEFESRSSSQSSRMGSPGSSGKTRSLQQRERVTITHLRDLNPGEFVATTSELKDFKVKFKQAKSDDVSLPEITFVTDEMVTENYLRIKSEVLMMFK